MDQIYPDNGLPEILLRFVAGGFNYHIFVSDSKPGLADLISTYTEAAWSGYAPIFVPDGAFVLSVVTSHICNISAPQIVFINNTFAAIQVYGFFITDPANTRLIAAARFDNAPINIVAGGGQAIIPQFGTFSGLAV